MSVIVLTLCEAVCALLQSKPCLLVMMAGSLGRWCAMCLIINYLSHLPRTSTFERGPAPLLLPGRRLDLFAPVAVPAPRPESSMSSEVSSHRLHRASNKRTAAPYHDTENTDMTNTKRRGKLTVTDPELVSACHALIQLCDSMSSTMSALASAANDIMTSISTMHMRANTATTRSAADFNVLLAALTHAHARVLREYHARSHAYNKWLDEKAEEADITSKQLAAVSAICASRSMHASALLHSVGMLAEGNLDSCASACVPVSTRKPVAFTGIAMLWRMWPDSAMSMLSGRGMKTYIKGTAGATRNEVLVYPRVADGALAEYVTPDDVCLILRDDAGTLIDVDVAVERAADGGLQLAYTVPTRSGGKLSLLVTVCGIPIGQAAIAHAGYDPINGTQFIAAYSAGADSRGGMAINSSGTVMATSIDWLHHVRLFQLSPSFEQTRVIGTRGTGPAQFSSPQRLCFTNDDMLLVCDKWNSRVQMFTVTGEFVSSLAVQQPVSIDAQGDMVVVGTGPGPIEVHSRSSGGLLCSFELRGEGPGQIGAYAVSVRFTPNGDNIIAVDDGNPHRLSLFTVDGVFLKHVGAQILAGRPSDVAFGAGDEIIVADARNARICVLSQDGSTLLKEWGSWGVDIGKLVSPSTLAVSGSRLYVMDSLRVQAFE